MLECILIGTATDLTCKPRSINEWSIEKLQCISSFFCCAISNKCKLPRPSIPASTKCYHEIWSFDSEKVGMWVCVCASDMQSQVFKHKALLYYIWCRAYIKPFLTINLLYKHTIKREDITPLHPSIYMFFSAIRSAPPIGGQKITFTPSYTFNFDPI